MEIKPSEIEKYSRNSLINGIYSTKQMYVFVSDSLKSLVHQCNLTPVIRLKGSVLSGCIFL